VIVGVLLQLSFFPAPLPHTLLSGAGRFARLLGGSMTGAVAGFSIGLLVDC